MQRLKVSWFLAAAFIGAVASLTAACGDTEASGSSAAGGGRCTPGKTEACVCTNGESGAQTCKADGTFSPCVCGDGGAGGAGGSGGAGGETPTKCGNNDIDQGEACDDGNTMNGDGCSSTCQLETCGNGIPNAGECGPEGDCPMDCMNCGNGKEDTGECGPQGACPEDCCLPENTQIVSAVIPMSPSVWSFGGKLGIDAGNDHCKTLNGSDHVCDYLEVVEAEKQGELAALVANSTIWIHRTTDLPNFPAGAGGRCNDWKYGTNHAADGEYGVVDANGVVQYFFDNDTIFNQGDNTHSQPGLLECGNTSRAILCCNTKCVPPPPN